MRQSMLEVRQAHRGHFFSPGAMRFFDSRISASAYHTADGKRAYFVTSERFNEQAPRLYTVRVIDMQTGDISTLGGQANFQRYASSSAAHAAALRAART